MRKEQGNKAQKGNAEQILELMEGLLEELLNKADTESGRPVYGVIELDPEIGLSIGLQEPEETSGKEKQDTDSRSSGEAKEAAILKKKQKEVPICDGCGEVFQEMLMDLHFMAKMILEADHMMKMVSEEGVNPEDARCVTYLSVRDARDIMKKWDAYRGDE